MSDIQKHDQGELILYQTDDGSVKLDVRLQDETIWLTQADLADLFKVSPQNITIHLKNIYAEGELDESATCKEFLQVQIEGNRDVERARKFYNLDNADLTNNDVGGMTVWRGYADLKSSPPCLGGVAAVSADGVVVR